MNLKVIPFHQDEYRKKPLLIPKGEYIFVGKDKFLISRDNISYFKFKECLGVYIFIPLENTLDLLKLEKEINKFKFIKLISGVINKHSFSKSIVNHLVYLIPLKNNSKINISFINYLINNYKTIKIYTNIETIFNSKIQKLKHNTEEIYGIHVPSSYINAIKIYNSNEIFVNINNN